LGKKEQDLLKRRSDKEYLAKGVPLAEAIAKISKSSFRSYYMRVNGGDKMKDPLFHPFKSFRDDLVAIILAINIACKKLIESSCDFCS